MNEGDIRAELPGSVLSVDVTEGAWVPDGGTVAVLESMKMEIPVLAERSGRLVRMAVSTGEVVRSGDLIAVLDHDNPDPHHSTS